VDKYGQHPDTFTSITEEDILEGRWRFNPALSQTLNISYEYGQEYLKHYARKLKESGKYNLTVWPYHAILGGIGHALVPAVEEAVFFHSLARATQASFQVKGDNPFTEHYSVLGPEVTKGPQKEPIGRKDQTIFQTLVDYDAVIIAGQAKSHCVAWTIADLLKDVLNTDKSLVEKVYLLEDCTSPVVIPGVIDYTEVADATFQRFARAGMHIVHSQEPLQNWPGILQGA
jgi:nicotinamidase-related amidase